MVALVSIAATTGLVWDFKFLTSPIEVSRAMTKSADVESQANAARLVHCDAQMSIQALADLASADTPAGRDARNYLHKLAQQAVVALNASTEDGNPAVREHAASRLAQLQTLLR